MEKKEKQNAFLLIVEKIYKAIDKRQLVTPSERGSMLLSAPNFDWLSKLEDDILKYHRGKVNISMGENEGDNINRFTDCNLGEALIVQLPETREDVSSIIYDTILYSLTDIEFKAVLFVYGRGANIANAASQIKTTQNRVRNALNTLYETIVTSISEQEANKTGSLQLCTTNQICKKRKANKPQAEEKCFCCRIR